MPSEVPGHNSFPPNKTISDIVGEAFRQEQFQAALKEACYGKTPEQIVQEGAMAVPMLLALTICPALLGTQEAIRQSQSKNKREEHRARRCNLVVSCVKQSIRSRDIDGKLVVLKDNKLWLTTAPPALHDEDLETGNEGYPFSGYFLPYPDSNYEGLVSTIADDPPMLNWIYIDRDTYEVKYGLRVDAQQHLTGPFDCTRQDRRMTMEGWEGFVAVEAYPGVWALYFDRDDDGLATKVPMGTRVLEVELTRREKKERKPEPDPNQPQTLDEKMRQHKEQSARQQEETDGFIMHGEEPQSRLREQAKEALNQESAGDISVPDDAAAESHGVESARDGIENLRLAVDEDGNIRDERLHSGRDTPTVASSAGSDSFSFWSAAKNMTGDSGDGASVTATSSADVDGASDVAFSHYRKPYVEDSPGPSHDLVDYSLD